MVCGFSVRQERTSDIPLRRLPFSEWMDRRDPQAAHDGIRYIACSFFRLAAIVPQRSK